MPQSPAQRVNALMAAFKFGGRCEDLGQADDKYRSDVAKHTAAMDGATLFGLDAEYKGHLKAALATPGYHEMAALKHAWNATIQGSPSHDNSDMDADWVPLPA